MRKDTPSVLLERVMPAAGVIQSARLGCPGTNYSERGSTEPSERRHQTRPCQRGHPWILDRPATHAEPRRASATGYSLRRYQILTTPLPFQSSKQSRGAFREIVDSGRPGRQHDGRQSPAFHRCRGMRIAYRRPASPYLAQPRAPPRRLRLYRDCVDSAVCVSLVVLSPAPATQPRAPGP